MTSAPTASRAPGRPGRRSLERRAGLVEECHRHLDDPIRILRSPLVNHAGVANYASQRYQRNRHESDLALQQLLRDAANASLPAMLAKNREFLDHYAQIDTIAAIARAIRPQNAQHDKARSSGLRHPLGPPSLDRDCGAGHRLSSCIAMAAEHRPHAQRQRLLPSPGPALLRRKSEPHRESRMAREPTQAELITASPRRQRNTTSAGRPSGDNRESLLSESQGRHAHQCLGNLRVGAVSTFSSPGSPMSESIGNGNPRVFLGFPYEDPYLSRYGSAVASAIREREWDPTMPLGEVPQGILLERITSLIGGSNRAVYDVSRENGNVCFELGISLTLRQPVALVSDRDPAELPDLFRTPWLHCYADTDACVSALAGFLELRSITSLVPPPRAPGEPELVTVVGMGERASCIARALQEAGRSVVCRRPSSIRSLADAVLLAESCGVLVVARPAAGEWNDNDLITALVTLGAAHAADRTAIIGAGPGEWVPSDCVPLVTQDTDDAVLASKVVSQIEQPARTLPPSGTVPSTVMATLPRSLQVPIADELRTRGRALLSAEPGFGKTTILHQVAEGLGFPTAWVTIEANWSVAQLIERVVAAVSEHVSHFGWQAWATVRRSQQAAVAVKGRVTPPSVPDTNQLAELLAEDSTTSIADDVLLVVDDVHKAIGDSARLLDRFAQCAPPWLRLVFAGRGAPEGLSAAAASGRIPCWAADELRFSRSETRTYLRQIVPGLDDERANLLHECSEGWPAALAVIRAWLAANDKASTEDLTKMTRGDRYRIYRLFATDYFVRLPQHVRDDLLSFSLPVRLDATVARRLLGSDGGIRLRTLAEGPYFLSEDEAGIFRLHSLFREFLCQRWIEERGSDSLKGARSALARWFQDRGDLMDAYQIACEAEDWTVAIDAIEPAAQIFAHRGEVGFS